MKTLKSFLKYKYILLAIMLLTIFSKIDISNVKDILQTNLSQGLKIIKVTDEKIKIDEKNIIINARMPEIHYSNEIVERYINSYIRRNINDLINDERQYSQLNRKKSKANININYHIVFENKSLLNMVVYKESKEDETLKYEKYSYIFDLNTGQRIYLNNLLKENEDYEEIIYKYIKNYIKENKLNINENKLNINKYTNYEIIDEGINVYFNPYKSSKEESTYEFKIPFSIFKNKVKMVQTSNILANIDTQTITKNTKYINSVINIPIVITENKEISKNINDEITNNIMKFFNENKLNINKYTNYEIIDEGINVYFNPYKSSKEESTYEFKIPFSIFKNKVKMVQTSNILANIDTQTITKNTKYINSVINIPIVITENKEISKNINDEITNNIMKFFNESESQAKEYYKDLPEIENKFVANVDFDIKKNSDNTLSILVMYYKYAGGAHGYSENVSYNVDMRTGKFILINDLFKNEVDYKSVINEEIRKQIEDLIKLDAQNNGIYEFKTIKENQKFYIQDDNLVIYFDLYDIAPYAAGIPEFIININKIDHILKPEYKEIFK